VTYVVPGRHHTRPIRHVVINADIVVLRECDLKCAVLSRNLPWLIPFEIAGLPVMEIDCLPVRVVPRVERAAVDVEFIREDEDIFGIVHHRLAGEGVPRCVGVDWGREARDERGVIEAVGGRLAARGRSNKVLLRKVKTKRDRYALYSG
jgi:hypothetical protein